MARARPFKAKIPPSTGLTASKAEKSSISKPKVTTALQKSASSLPINTPHIDESRAVVISAETTDALHRDAVAKQHGGDLNGVDDDGDSVDGTESISSESAHEVSWTGKANWQNGVADSDSEKSAVQMVDETQAAARDDAQARSNDLEPSFGDLVEASTNKEISIADALPSEPNTLVPTESGQQISHLPAVSLSTVLTQALRTNDNKLVETCLLNTDTKIIKATLQRIDPAYAGMLMQTLAERLSSRPGRYGNLITWVQWICVTHGGAIASQLSVRSNITTLYNVLNQRSKALDPLLLLKGKLDMLHAQLDLRRQLAAQRAVDSTRQAGHLIYVEGEEPADESDADVAMEHADPTAMRADRATKNHPKSDPANRTIASDDEDGMPLTNGIVAESGDSDLDSEEDADALDQDDDALVDEEAEESDDEGVDESPFDDEDEDDQGGLEDEADSEMDAFIDDGSIEQGDSTSEPPDHVSCPSPPPAKKQRR